MEKTVRSPALHGPNENPLPASDARVIRQVLVRYDHNRTAATRELGVIRTTLWRKIRHLPII